MYMCKFPAQYIQKKLFIQEATEDYVIFLTITFMKMFIVLFTYNNNKR